MSEDNTKIESDTVTQLRSISDSTVMVEVFFLFCLIHSLCRPSSGTVREMGETVH